MDTLVQLILEGLDPSVDAHTWSDLTHVRCGVRVAALVQTLLHCGLELVGNLGIAVAMENAPSLQGRLREHLTLNLAIQVASIRLNVDGLWSATRAGSHLELARSVLESSELLRSLVELEVPKLLLLDTLRVRLEVVHQVLDLLDLGIGVCVHDLGQVLHEAEVSAHGISQARQLAQLRNEGNLITRAAVLVDEQRLIHVVDVLVVASLVVLLVARRSPVLVEGSAGTLRKVDPVNLVGLLVVPGHHRASSECFLHRLLGVHAASTVPLGFVSHIVHVVQTVVCPNDFEADVNVEKDA